MFIVSFFLLHLRDLVRQLMSSYYVNTSVKNRQKFGKWWFDVASSSLAIPTIIGFAFIYNS